MKFLLLAVLLSPVQLAAPVDPEVEKACPGGICTIPAAKLQALLDAHNWHVAEIEELTRALRLQCQITRHS